MKTKRVIAVLFTVVVTMFLLSGCASQTQALLAEDYTKMGNEELLRYFYRLDDEIERQEKAWGPEIGIGIGTFGHHSGMGVGVGTGPTGYTADDLRNRRIDVRLELKKRGLNP
ncbi:MAG: hypothetical protein A4E74_01932 [Syntrophus sp. PtaB.Bin075]|nr:MAG: hypothetical protein A4E74_01932 [Syntrophus sp. PtaB.Bin075]